VFQGNKRHRLHAEHFNWHHHLPWPETDGRRIVVPEVGIEIDVVEPLSTHALDYRDVGSGTSLHLTTRAVMPPAVRGNGLHFEQAMHVLVRGNTTHAIDCVGMRDRSWGEPRPEAGIKHPPIAYGVGASPDGKLAFTFNGTDDPQTADWADLYSLPPDRQLLDGWIWRHGELRRIVRMSRRCSRDGLLRPTELDIDLLDDHGESLVAHGTVRGVLPFSPWQMMQAHWCRVRWSSTTGTVLPGELQDVCWADYVQQRYGARNDTD
jgi:hypothetical protein